MWEWRDKSRVEMRAFFLPLVCMGSLGKAKLHSVEQLLLCYCRGQPFNSMQRSKFLYAHQWAMVPHFSSADFPPSLSHTHLTISVKVNMGIFTFRCNFHGFPLLFRSRTIQVGWFWEDLVCTLCSSLISLVGYYSAVTHNDLTITELLLEKNNLAYVALHHLFVSKKKNRLSTIWCPNRKRRLTQHWRLVVRPSQPSL